MKKLLFILTLLALLIPAALAVTPTGISLPEEEITLDLADGDKWFPQPMLEPADASGSLKWWVSDTRVLKAEDGYITLLRPGTATVSVGIHGVPGLSAKCVVTVTDSRVPERLLAYPTRITLEPSRSALIESVVLPQSAGREVRYVSGNPDVAEVDAEGRITARSVGSANIYVRSIYDDSVSQTVRVTVAYGERITALEFGEATAYAEIGESLIPDIRITPENGSRAYTLTSSEESVAVVDADGVIHALRYGSTVITAVSYRDPDIQASFTLMVSDADRPDRIECDFKDRTLLHSGESAELCVKLLPETAHTEYSVTTSRPDIVAVNGNTLSALSRGKSRITVSSLYDPEVCVSYDVFVEDGTVAVALPLRRTDAEGIEENLAAIERLRLSALDALSGLEDKERQTRTRVINEAFEMYAFPWTVESEQKYWEAANSEDGAKDFKPGTIYYGLPYTSGTNHNRTYNVKRALEQNRFVPDAGGRYYLLNPLSEDYAMGYAGNDCSAYVALALWGYTMHEGDTVKTGTLYYDYRLRAFDDASQLKPGDILVRHSSHVVMFLYWVDEAHTQAMIIQQGGSEPAINTVNAVVEEITYYTEDSYRLRRLAEY